MTLMKFFNRTFEKTIVKVFPKIFLLLLFCKNENSFLNPVIDKAKLLAVQNSVIKKTLKNFENCSNSYSLSKGSLSGELLRSMIPLMSGPRLSRPM